MHIVPKEKEKKLFNKTLFAWHKDHYRDMLWRRTKDPYRLLISEVMLQQTQVDRVREKYTLFLRQFPSVQALANASLGKVLRVWSGLGYNRRAKYLHQCAKKVVDEYRGKFPKTYEELLELPGIGMSTAGALLAFAFGEDTPMIDTNIRRILVRVFFSSRLNLEAQLPSDKELFLFALTLIPKGRGRMWNYAMLDLGAALCTARHHRAECPLQKFHGNVKDFSYKNPQKKFAGSDRFYRGKLLVQLMNAPSTKDKLGTKLNLEDAVMSNILAKLVAEGLVVKVGSTYSLP